MNWFQLREPDGETFPGFVYIFLSHKLKKTWGYTTCRSPVHQRIVGFAVSHCGTAGRKGARAKASSNSQTKRLRSQNEVLRASNGEFHITSLLVHAIQGVFTQSRRTGSTKRNEDQRKPAISNFYAGFLGPPVSVPRQQ